MTDILFLIYHMFSLHVLLLLIPYNLEFFKLLNRIFCNLCIIWHTITCLSFIIPTACYISIITDSESGVKPSSCCTALTLKQWFNTRIVHAGSLAKPYLHQNIAKKTLQ